MSSPATIASSSTTSFTAAASSLAVSSSSRAATSSPMSTSPTTVDALFASAHCQRLLKLRHQDMDKMEIETKTLAASMNHDQTRFTVYKLAIQSSVRRDAPVVPQHPQASTTNTSDASSSGAWLLEKRYSEFAFFRRDVLQHMRNWHATLDHVQRKVPHCQPPAYTLAVRALQQPLTSTKFPRKHMRCDTREIIQQRRVGLEDFVRRLLVAYADISVYLSNVDSLVEATDDETVNSKEQLQALFGQLEAFLCVPDTQKEAERRQADAIQALVDVDGVSNDVKERQETHATTCCCICLEDTTTAAGITTTTTTDTLHEHLQRNDKTKNKRVQLPCRHEFHEDCIIDWFNASTTCPLCRRQAYREYHPRVFDVTMRELTEL